MPLSQAYRDYNQTHVNVNDVPRLTDYLIKQDQPEIAMDRWLELRDQHRANQKFNHQLDLAAIGTMLAPVLGVAGAEVAPFLAPGTVGGTLIGETAGGMAMGELLNKGTEMLTGRNWGDNVRNTLESTFGYNPESWSYGQGAYNFLTDMTNPGYWNGSKWLKNTANSVYGEAGKTLNKISDISNELRNTYDALMQQYVRHGIGKNNPELAYKIMKVNDYLTRPIKTRRAMKAGFYDSPEPGPNLTNAKWREAAEKEISLAKEKMKEYPASRFNEILKNANVTDSESTLQRQWNEYLNNVDYSPNSDLYNEIDYAKQGGLDAFFNHHSDITDGPSVTILPHKPGSNILRSMDDVRSTAGHEILGHGQEGFLDQQVERLGGDWRDVWLSVPDAEGKYFITNPNHSLYSTIAPIMNS